MEHHRNYPEYYTWSNMVARCHRETATQYEDYGGRGIKVCDEWRGRGGFVRFIEHIGRRPTPNHTLDRIDNERGYEPGNVRWASRVEQNNNSRKNVHLVLDGVRRTIAEWAAITGMRHNTIRARLESGWSVEKTLTTPVRFKRESSPRGGG